MTIRSALPSAWTTTSISALFVERLSLMTARSIGGAPSADPSTGHAPVHWPTTPPGRQRQLRGQPLLGRGMTSPTW